MVSDALVEQIRERADLVEICGDYMSLKRVGKTFRGPCPLHGGEGPNFSVDPARGIFKCFVCGEGGDVFAFLMKHLGLDFPSAVREVGRRVGIEVPDDTEPREDPWSGLREVVAFAEEWFAGRLREASIGRPARDYLERRGLDMRAAERYALGFAPDSWRELREAASIVGIGDEALLEAGLLSTSERAEEPYDRFRNRLTFSIRDIRDRPVGFGGRDLSGESAVPKYINSPDSPIFHKGRSLYALSWARHAIRKEERALVVEGYMDALALHVAGLEAAVAPLGTSLTEEQAGMLARYAERAYLLYDSDAAGLRATFRAADTLLAAGVQPLVVTLPDGEDPDSLVRGRGAGALRALLEDAVDVIERKLQILERRGYLESIDGRRRAVDGMLSTLRAVRDPTLRDLYIGRIVERTGVRRETLVHEIASAEERAASRRPASRRGGSSTRGEGDVSPEEDPAERDLLLLLLRDTGLVEKAVEAGVRAEHFREPDNRELFEALTAGSGDEAAPGELPEDMTAAVRARAARLRAEERELTHPGQIFEEAVRQLVYRSRLARLRAIDREMEMADEPQARRLLEEKARLAAELREAGVRVSFLGRWSRSDTIRARG